MLLMLALRHVAANIVCGAAPQAYRRRVAGA